MPRLSGYKIIVFLFIFAFFILPQTILANWPIYRFDYMHSGAVSYSIDEIPKIKWTTEDLGPIEGSPAVDSEGNIYIGVTNKGLVAIDSSGNKKWSFLSFAPSISVAIDLLDNIYYSTSGCNPQFYSLDKNGNKRWQYDLREGGGVCGSNSSSSAVTLSADETTLYVTVNSPFNGIFAFNLDGTIKWRLKINQEPSGSSVALASDGTLYVGSRNGRLFSISKNGVLNWQRVAFVGLNVWANTPLIGKDGNIYITSQGVSGGQIISSYNPLGNKRWSYQVSSNSFSGLPANKGNFVYTVEKNKLRAFNISDGSLIWEWIPPISHIFGLHSPVIDKNGLIITSADNKLYAISEAGTLVWEVTLSSFLNQPIIAENGLIYIHHVNSNKGFLNALGAAQLPSAPEPFLDLPWDYEGKGLSFNEAALSINSFFDHEYPLLSSGIGEPDLLTDYEGKSATRLSYSSHDGYDYGKPAKVNLGDPVLAAASGTATYVNSCSACGNMILIDHHNGYQTRYLHMQKDGLIISIPGQKVEVIAGQPVGKVGATGNVSPPNDAGSHIHFGVFQDKNGDGNFNDNVPDGVTDPFGWQSSDPDPWQSFEFLYGDIERIGNKSYYLWKKKIDNLDATLTANGGVFKTERFTLDFPQGATDKNLKLKIKSNPNINISQILSSIGSTIIATAVDPLGNLVTQFQSLFSITVNFSLFDLSRFRQDSISFYSSEDGVTWKKENTLVDLANKTATTQVDHMSYFALVAERLDTIPPITTPILEGQQGQEGWLKSDAKLTLNPIDNEGGLGVDYTMYRKQGEDWEIYNEPLTFTNEGYYKVEFYSADNDENLEEIRSIEFNIDKTPPEVSIDANPKELWPPNGKMESINVSGKVEDEHLLNSKILVDDEYDLIEPETNEPESVIELEVRREGSDEDGRMYIIKIIGEDLAGNISEGEVEVIVPHDKRKDENE